jgi:hypothetical protein
MVSSRWVWVYLESDDQPSPLAHQFDQLPSVQMLLIMMYLLMHFGYTSRSEAQTTAVFSQVIPLLDLQLIWHSLNNCTFLLPVLDAALPRLVVLPPCVTPLYSPSLCGVLPRNAKPPVAQWPPPVLGFWLLVLGLVAIDQQGIYRTMCHAWQPPAIVLIWAIDAVSGFHPMHVRSSYTCLIVLYMCCSDIVYVHVSDILEENTHGDRCILYRR